MSIQIVPPKTLRRVVHNSNPQKFFMFLLNAYPIQSSYAVINLVIEDARPAHTHSRSDVKIFTLFVNPCKHFVGGLACPALNPPNVAIEM